MEIRSATDDDREEIVELYIRSQASTNIPNPLIYPPDELGDNLYARDAINRYVSIVGRKIVGHGLIERPNPLSLNIWLRGVTDVERPSLIEMGGAFVDPDYMRQGIYTNLLSHHLKEIHGLGAIPVAATWIQNTHVMRLFQRYGGLEVGTQHIQAGDMKLFVFRNRQEF